METTIYISHGGMQDQVDVAAGTELGAIRAMTAALEDLAVPSSYNLAINGVQAGDNTVLSQGDTVTFRPVTSSKG